MNDDDRGTLEDLDPRALLREVKDTRAVEYAAAARLIDLAARWADLHPPESIEDTAVFFADRGGEIETPIAGPGCPAVAEFCVADLGAALGVSTLAAKRLMGHALELRHRLPRLWARVQDGEVPPWRARSVAEETIQAHPALTKEAAAWVDAQVAPFAAGIGHAQIQRMVTEAIRRFQLADPALPDTSDQAFGGNRRKVELMGDLTPYRSTVFVEAVLSVADALDLDRNLTHRAATLAALGSTEPLDTRRSQALGDLAREQTALDLAGLTSDDERPDRLPAAREVVLHVHMDVDESGTGLAPTVRVEEGQRLQTLDQIRTWCSDSHTEVTIKPVIDLHQRIEAPGYAIPDRIREQVILRDSTCVFPWCSRPARSCQIDHVVPYDHHPDEARPSGQTATDNLAALCTRHHRLKTHGRWRYDVIGPGEYAWRDGHGNHYLRDRYGSRETEPAEPAEPARP